MTADLVSVVMARVRERQPMRPPARKTHCKRGHEFTAKNTRLSPEGWKSCRACDRERRRDRVRVRRPEYATVQCPDCGDLRQLSKRQAFRIETGEHSGLCPICLGAPVPVVTGDLQGWWLERFTLEEIREMAASLDWFIGEEHRAR